MLISLLFFASQNAQAVPLQLTQQGRVVDANGAAMVGTEFVFFRIYDDASSGNLLWEEYIAISFNNGYYAAMLGTDVQNNPLDSSTLSLYPLYMEIQVGTNTPMIPRTTITSVPYAQIAGVAESVSGGSVDASDVSIAGNPVVDSSGSWVGQPILADWSNVTNVPGDIADGDANTQLSETQVEGYVNNDAIDLHPSTTMNLSGLLTQADVLTPDWSNVTNRPAGLDDGDDDTLAGLGCSPGEIVGWDGAGWICTSDASLSEAEVEDYVTNGGINLDAASTVGGHGFITTNDQSLSGLACLDTEIPRWDGVSSEWYCASDGLAQVVCGQGEVMSYNTATSNWDCTTVQTLLDADADGVMAWADCDDNDPNALSSSNDNDCDGVTTPFDCNDSDPSSNTTLVDADCDGTLTADDCNDSDANSTIVANDNDCDGSLAVDDCDDNDATRSPDFIDVCNDGIDNDCDGFDDMSCVGLFTFATHTFTNCGASGTNGPALSNCNSQYGTSWSSNTNFFNVVSGVQQWTVPEDGNYQITARGAQGGPNHCGNSGALGAQITGDFALTKNTVLYVVVGQEGQVSPSGNCYNGGGGGGGGSFVWENGSGQPLIAAGGGGGSNLINNGSPYYLGGGGVTSNDGGASRAGDNGGTNGGDGASDGGGKGWLSILSDATGTNSNSSYNGTGGFGGGGRGGGNCGSHVSGGGGGYSGGSAAGCYYAAGGGGSYNVGANQSNSADNNSSHGSVVITFLSN